MSESVAKKAITIPESIKLCRSAIELMVQKPAQKGRVRYGGKEIIATADGENSWDDKKRVWRLMPCGGDESKKAVEVNVDSLQDVTFVTDSEYNRLQQTPRKAS